MPNETTHSNKIWLEIGDNFCLKKAPPPPRPPCHDGVVTSVLLVPYLSVHDMIRSWPIRKEYMYDETNYIRYSIITQKKERKKFKRKNYQRRQLMGTNFPLNLHFSPF